MCGLSPYFARVMSAILLVLLAAASCGKRKEETVRVIQKRVRLYTSVPVKIIEGIKLEFETDHPEIELEVFRAETAKIMKRLYQEAETGEPGADVIWPADFSVAEELKQKGFLQRFQSPEVANIIPIFTDAHGYYTGSRLLNMVVAYNTRFIKNSPEGYWDLLKPDWKGKVGFVDPGVSGASSFTVATLLQDKEYGWEYFAKLYRNQCEIVDNNPALTEKIAGGELYIGITIDFTIRKLLEESPSLPLDCVFPKDGLVAIASPIAISRDCRDLAGARTLVNWVLSERGQAFMSTKMGIAPVRTDVAIPKGMIPLQQLRIIPSNARTIFESRSQTMKIFSDIFSGKSLDLIEMTVHQE